MDILETLPHDIQADIPMEAATKLACNIHRQFVLEVGMAPPDLHAWLEEPCRPPPLKRRRGAAKDEGDHEDQDADYGQADEHDEDENEEEEDDPAPASAGPGLEGDGRAGEKAVEEAVVLPPLHQPAEVRYLRYVGHRCYDGRRGAARFSLADLWPQFSRHSMEVARIFHACTCTRHAHIRTRLPGAPPDPLSSAQGRNPS